MNSLLMVEGRMGGRILLAWLGGKWVERTCGRRLSDLVLSTLALPCWTLPCPHCPDVITVQCFVLTEEHGCQRGPAACVHQCEKMLGLVVHACYKLCQPENYGTDPLQHLLG